MKGLLVECKDAVHDGTRYFDSRDGAVRVGIRTSGAVSVSGRPLSKKEMAQVVKVWEEVNG